jgi:hypothetical protein
MLGMQQAACDTNPPGTVRASEETVIRLGAAITGPLRREATWNVVLEILLSE